MYLEGGLSIWTCLFSYLVCMSVLLGHPRDPPPLEDIVVRLWSYIPVRLDDRVLIGRLGATLASDWLGQLCRIWDIVLIALAASVLIRIALL